MGDPGFNQRFPLQPPANVGVGVGVRPMPQPPIVPRMVTPPSTSPTGRSKEPRSGGKPYQGKGPVKSYPPSSGGKEVGPAKKIKGRPVKDKKIPPKNAGSSTSAKKPLPKLKSSPQEVMNPSIRKIK